jgi:NADPH:quinone reductase-like Zn-dependent oxidoreductase
MLAVTAVAADADDPLRAMEIGEQGEPQVPPGWELVEVRAASVNRHDLWSLQGVGLPSERLPMILGGDAAGVTADGREVIVHGVIAGEDGFGPETPDAPHSLLSERYPGTHAERVAVPGVNLVDKPPELSFVEAACLPVAWLTAYRMLFVQGLLRPGQRVLVQGAGGGVATACIVLGRAAGLTVYATSRSAEKRARAEELGAHVTVETGERLPERVDVVIETVGEATWGHSLRSVEAGGIVVTVGGTSGFNPPAELPRVFFRQVRIQGSTMGTRRELTELVRMLVATGVRPVVDDTLPLAGAREAYAKVHRGDVFGKVVLTVD